MLTYQAPWRDMRFVIEELLQLPAQWPRMPGLGHVDAELARELIDQGARFAIEQLAPCNSSGDLEGCRLEDGDVRTPAGFRDAYRRFFENGWPSLPCSQQDSGQGLPTVLNAALFEMCFSTNHAWCMYTSLMQAAYECLRLGLSPELRERYLGKMVSGQWLCTMCLSEPQAGSDLGLITTKAVPQADGTYAISGTKIFISSGDHDLTENILHLILARLPDAPPGPKGLSLFVTTKWLADDAAGHGPRNTIYVDSIERKMGIRGSATCVLRFDGAVAWLVGAPNRGLAAMFPMMNTARLFSGVQGLGHAEAAFQNALRYARERRQLRTVQARDPGPSRLVEHPAIRRLLFVQRARVEGGRFLCYQTAHLIDSIEHAADESQREQARRLAALLTPIVKAALTSIGFEVASDSLQVWGGHGYLRDTGIEQTVRDARIGMIYEGTNQIQAIDLLARKGMADGGRGLDELFDWLAKGLPPQGAHTPAVQRHIQTMAEVTREIVAGAADDAELPLRVADDYLAAMALLLFAQGFARADHVATTGFDTVGADRPFYSDKQQTARFFIHYMLPDMHARVAQIRASAAWLPAFAAAT